MSDLSTLNKSITSSIQPTTRPAASGIETGDTPVAGAGALSTAYRSTAGLIVAGGFAFVSLLVWHVGKC
jgi:hypothetical protein